MLDFLNVSKNPMVEVSLFSFKNSRILIIVSENYKICCVKHSKETRCKLKPYWPNSCKRLVADVTANVFMSIVGVVGLGPRLRGKGMVVGKVNLEWGGAIIYSYRE